MVDLGDAAGDFPDGSGVALGTSSDGSGAHIYTYLYSWGVGCHSFLDEKFHSSF